MNSISPSLRFKIKPISLMEMSTEWTSFLLQDIVLPMKVFVLSPSPWFYRWFVLFCVTNKYGFIMWSFLCVHSYLFHQSNYEWSLLLLCVFRWLFYQRWLFTCIFMPINIHYIDSINIDIYIQISFHILRVSDLWNSCSYAYIFFFLRLFLLAISSFAPFCIVISPNDVGNSTLSLEQRCFPSSHTFIIYFTADCIHYWFYFIVIDIYTYSSIYSQTPSYDHPTSRYAVTPYIYNDLSIQISFLALYNLITVKVNTLEIYSESLVFPLLSFLIL